VRSGGHSEVNMMITVFWNVTLYSLIDTNALKEPTAYTFTIEEFR
jgi:hypothetical protein